MGDQIGPALFTLDLSKAIRDLVRADAHTILHVTNECSCSWFEFAAEILRQASWYAVCVVPIAPAGAAHAAERQAHSLPSRAVLDSGIMRLRHQGLVLGAQLKDLREKLYAIE